MTTSLSNFRDIVQLIHRVVRPDALHSHDLRALIDKVHDVLSSSYDTGCDCEPIVIKAEPFSELLRPPTPPTLVIHADQEVGEVIPNVVVTKEEPEIREVRNLIVNLPAVVQAVKLETPRAVPPSSDAAILKDLALDMGDEDEVDDEPDVSDIESVPESVPIDDDEAASEAESVEEDDATEDDADTDMDEEEEAEEEEEEEAEEEEEEEEEDDDLELLKIKKQRYYWSPSSKRIYEHLEEGYGDCIGTYEDGKIIPKA